MKHLLIFALFAVTGTLAHAQALSPELFEEAKAVIPALTSQEPVQLHLDCAREQDGAVVTYTCISTAIVSGVVQRRAENISGPLAKKLFDNSKAGRSWGEQYVERSAGDTGIVVVRSTEQICTKGLCIVATAE